MYLGLYGLWLRVVFQKYADFYERAVFNHCFDYEERNLLQNLCKFLPGFTVSQITRQSVSESPPYALRCEIHFSS